MKSCKRDSEVAELSKPEYEEKRQKGLDCDFKIIVGEDSFCVHQDVLTTSSDYFRAMLSQDTKEKQKGLVVMKEIESNAMKLCIEFMYTDATNITMETAKIVLPVSELLQLTDLSKNCVKELDENLNSGNCISVLKLAQLYNCIELAEKALKKFQICFKMKDFNDFIKFNKEGIAKHISDHKLNITIAWEGIINWIKIDIDGREDDILDLFKLLNCGDFPSSGTLKNIWAERKLWISSETCRKIIFRCIFLDSTRLKNRINSRKCFILTKMAHEFDYVSMEAWKVILDYMRIKLVEISYDNDFLHLSEEDILLLFDTNEVKGFCAEYLRWEVALKWIKHDQNRKEILPKLMKHIQFNRIPKEYFDSTVAVEPLINEIPDCYKILYTSLNSKQHKETHIVVLYPEGEVYALQISDKSWRRIPDVRSGVNSRVFAFNDNLCSLVNGTLFYLGRNMTEWIKKEYLFMHPNEKIVTSGDFIYPSMNKCFTVCYDSRNTKRINLCNSTLDGDLFAAATDTEVYVGNSGGKLNKFSNKTKEWGEEFQIESVEIKSMVSRNNEIYFGANVRTFGMLNKNSFHPKAEWKCLKDFPVVLASRSVLFEADGKILLFQSDVFYVYDCMYDTWATFYNLPEFSKGGLGNAGRIENPISVCAFRADLQHLPIISTKF